MVGRNLYKRRLLFVANRHFAVAAVGETANRLGIDRGGDFAPEQDPLGAVMDTRYRYGGKQRLGIRVQGV